MSLLWTVAKRYGDEDDDWRTSNETHDDHTLNPAFQAAGIKPSPCGYSLCQDHDPDYSDAFDEAERRSFKAWKGGQKSNLPVERMDLSQPVHGFEPHTDMHTLRRYTKHPESRGSHPVWFRWQGQHYIFNGHHGTAAALRRGDSHLDVHMIDLDKDDD